jgi:hypothetical protein
VKTHAGELTLEDIDNLLQNELGVNK